MKRASWKADARKVRRSGLRALADCEYQLEALLKVENPSPEELADIERLRKEIAAMQAFRDPKARLV